MSWYSGNHDTNRLVIAQFGRFGQRIDVGAQDPIGDHHALGFARRTARVLQDHEALGIVGWDLQRIARGDVRRTGHDAPHRQDRWIARLGDVEVGEQIVDQHELGVAVTDTTSGALDEDVERPHPHRQRQNHRGQRPPSSIPARWSSGRGWSDPESPRGRRARGTSAWSAAPTERASSWICRQLDVHRAFCCGHRRPDERHPGARVGSELESLDGRQRFVVAHPHDASPPARRTRCVGHIVYAAMSGKLVPMARVLLTGADLLIDGRLTRRNVTLDGPDITAIGDDVDSDAEIVDCRGLVISPGFIDLQCNGAFGIDLTTEPSGIEAMARGLPRFGVTSFLPTVVTSPATRRRAAIEAMHDVHRRDPIVGADADRAALRRSDDLATSPRRPRARARRDARGRRDRRVDRIRRRLPRDTRPGAAGRARCDPTARQPAAWSYRADTRR